MKEATSRVSLVYFLAVPWTVAKISPSLMIYGGKGGSVLCENSIFLLEVQEKEKSEPNVRFVC